MEDGASARNDEIKQLGDMLSEVSQKQVKHRGSHLSVSENSRWWNVVKGITLDSLLWEKDKEINQREKKGMRSNGGTGPQLYCWWMRGTDSATLKTWDLNHSHWNFALSSSSWQAGRGVGIGVGRKYGNTGGGKLIMAVVLVLKYHKP